MNGFRDKNIVVVGMARSGISAARFLRSCGANVFITEKNISKKLEDAANMLKVEGIFVECGTHSKGLIAKKDLVVLSPGVRMDSEPAQWAGELGVELISEIELAASVCPAPIIAITGTNGKTTTTTLVGEIIRASGRRAHVLGNIGTPFSSAVLDIKKEDYVSLETSSFQLEAIKKFKPKVAVILNLTPDHMDRYSTVEEYLGAKKRIFLNQDNSDCLVLNYSDPSLLNIAREARSRVEFFNKEPWEKEFNQNQMAVLAVARVLNIDKKICEEVFKNFKGVEHRMEFVRELNGIEFINDSKATNIDSTIWALNNIKKPAVLLAGGRDKGSDFAAIKELVKEKIKEVVVAGEASERIFSAWSAILPVTKANTFPEAVSLAFQKASSGEIVLFSPMCKSFDMFTDYEHRGRAFKELVQKLTPNLSHRP